MIVEVVESNPKLYSKFNSLLKHGNVIVLYYANWCPHCVNMKPEWDRFKQKCKSDPKYKHLKIAEVESEHISNTNAANEVQGFPTIKFYKKNTTKSNIPPKTVDFHEDRTVNKLLKFTNSNTDEHVEKKIANMNKAEMNDGEMNEGEMNEGEMNEAEMNEGEMNEGEMNEGEMNEGEMNEAEMNEAEMNEAEMNGKKKKSKGLKKDKVKKSKFLKKDKVKKPKKGSKKEKTKKKGKKNSETVKLRNLVFGK
jgi:thiol-disulfide isomerase/thioredoxin